MWATRWLSRGYLKCRGNSPTKIAQRTGTRRFAKYPPLKMEFPEYDPVLLDYALRCVQAAIEDMRTVKLFDEAKRINSEKKKIDIGRESRRRHA